VIVVGALGPWWVAKVLLGIGLLGLVAAAVARARGHRFWPWLIYGVSLPVVALPHAVLAGTNDTGAASCRPGGLLGRLGLTPATACTVLGLAVTNVVLLDFHGELFGAAWQYVMWEGGVIEGLTPINFVLGALVFGLAAREAREDAVRRRWLITYAVADVVLAGEEISWGRGQLLLDLDDPSFATKYNPTATLHNHLLPGVGPVVVFFVIIAAFRLFYPVIRARLKAPMAVGFLNAVLLTLLAAPFMRFDPAHFLFFDEVYEWSGSVLLLHLALYERWRWSFTR
jgi:hypothetical protein